MFGLLYQFRVIFSSQRWWCAVDAYPDLPSSIRLLSMNWTNAIHSRLSNESDEIMTYKSKLKQPIYNSLCKMINRWCPMNRTLTSAPVTAELLLLLVDLEINHKFPLPKFVRRITIGVTSIANMFRWPGKAATPPKTRLNLASKPYQSVMGLHDLNLNNMDKSESRKSTCVQSIFRCSKSSVYQPCFIQAACLKETLYYWSLMFRQLQPCCINGCVGRLDCHLKSLHLLKAPGLGGPTPATRKMQCLWFFDIFWMILIHWYLSIKNRQQKHLKRSFGRKLEMSGPQVLKVNFSPFFPCISGQSVQRCP